MESARKEKARRENVGESEKRERARREKARESGRKRERARRKSADKERKTFGRLSPADRENKWSGRG